VGETTFFKFYVQIDMSTGAYTIDDPQMMCSGSRDPFNFLEMIDNIS